MLDNDKNIESLTDKFFAGTASSEEIQEINAWYNSFDDTTAIIHTADNSNKEALAQKIKGRLFQAIGDGPTETAPVKYLSSKRIVIAASVIAILGLSLFAVLTFLHADNNITVAKTFTSPTKQKVIPATDKAYLTLSDGTIVLLDSIAQGNISVQGAVQIKKLANGQIAYVVNGKTLTEKDAAFYNTITTPRGGKYKVLLSDETFVWLNAESSIRFPVVFAANERRITITGEAYLEVAKDKNKSFKVELGTAEVEVLGTHFNVNAYPDEQYIATTLLEGSVRVRKNELGSIAKVIAPGQQALVNGTGNISILSNVDTEQIMAWKNEVFLYKSTNLSSILRQLSRWYDVDIEYRGNADMNFTGQLPRNEEVTKVLKMLALTGEVNFTLSGRKIIVTKNKY